MENNFYKIGPHFVNLKLFSARFALVKIDVKNDQGDVKMSLWEEVNSGYNVIAVDLSSLSKGTYSIRIKDAIGNLKLSEYVEV